MEKITFNLHFTDFCNFNCKHCFVAKQNKELSFADIKLIGDELAKFSRDNNIAVRVNLAGGEPFCSPNLQPIIDYYYSLGLKLSIITNGFYLNEDFIKENSNKLSMIGISVDSLNEDVNRNIGRCTKEKMIISETEIISKCALIKKYGIKLKINICINSLNKEEDFSNFIELVKPDRLKFLRVLCTRNNCFEISNKDWKEITDKYSSYEPVFEDNECMRQKYFIIDSEGNLSKDNLHLASNSLLDYSVEECMSRLLYK